MSEIVTATISVTSENKRKLDGIWTFEPMQELEEVFIDPSIFVRIRQKFNNSSLKKKLNFRKDPNLIVTLLD